MNAVGGQGEGGRSAASGRARVSAAIVAAVLLTPFGGYMAFARWRRALTFAALQCMLTMLAIVGILRSWPWAAWACALVALGSFAAAVVDLGLLARRTTASGRRSALGLTGVPAVAVFLGGLQPVQAHVIDSFRTVGTMLPTLTSGDHFLMDKRRRAPRRGDVVVFRFPPAPVAEYVQRAKRVVALAGDTVELREGTLASVVNGSPVTARALGWVSLPAANVHVRRQGDRYQEWEETFEARSYRVLRVPGGERSSFGPVTVPPGHFFMLRDNRDNNNDSRLYGTIPVDSIIGHALWIWWSSRPDGGVQWDRLGRRL
jgi:signal peptidase I